MTTIMDERRLHADAISVRFGALAAVDGVSIEVRPGEIIGLIGPNGAGKSTFFNALTGFLGGAEGRATVDGVDIGRRPPWVIASLGVSRTFQNRSVFPELSVAENLDIAHAARRARDATPSFTATDAWRELEEFVLSGKPSSNACDLAYGQQRFLSLAMALAVEPEYLLLDEPAAGLNASESRAVGELLRAACGADIGIVLVEHDMSFLMPLVNRVYVLDAGRMIASGSAEEVQADPAVRAAYLGSPGNDA
jgi:ABC-type branched-subunit amino acid transport system ATPase component